VAEVVAELSKKASPVKSPLKSQHNLSQAKLSQPVALNEHVEAEVVESVKEVAAEENVAL